MAHDKSTVNTMNSAPDSSSAADSYAAINARRVSLEALWHRGSCLATFFRARGVKEDQAVAILMRNDLAFLECTIAISILGAYAVPLNWHLTGPEIDYILRDSAAVMLVSHADLYRPIAASIPDNVLNVVGRTPEEISEAYNIAADQCDVPPGVIDLEQAAETSEPLLDRTKVGSRNSILYTSGTTGRPKGVRKLPLPAEEMRKNALVSQQWFDLKPGVRTVMAGPMYHSAPNTYTRQVVNSGGSITLMPRFDAEELLAIIARDWWGPVIHEYYGATETGMVTRSSTQEWLERPGTLGKAWPGRSIRIYSDDGQVLGPNQVGEIYSGLQGVANFTYHNAEEQRLEIDRDGMVTNGDVGYLDEDGYLFLVDRKKDIVISGGVNIYPAEIECALIEHPGVADCAVIGIPDEEFGEKLLAFVKPSAGAQPSQIDISTFLRGKLAGLKVPKDYVFLDELPRDDSGKLMKRKLRDPYWAGRSRMI